MSKRSLLSVVRDALKELDSEVGRKGSDFIVRREFFFTHGFTADKFQAEVERCLTAAGLTFEVIEAYETWKPFKGGAPTARQSHWGVVFAVAN